MSTPNSNQDNTRNSVSQEGAWLATFRSRVIGLFEETGLTQEAFAKDLGRKQGTVQRWIDRRGKTVPDAAGIVRLVEYFGISAQWLLTGAGDRDAKPRAETDLPVVRRQVAREMRALVQQAVERALAEYVAPARSVEDDAAAKTTAAWKAERRAQPRPADPPGARRRSG